MAPRMKEETEPGRRDDTTKSRSGPPSKAGKAPATRDQMAEENGNEPEEVSSLPWFERQPGRHQIGAVHGSVATCSVLTGAARTSSLAGTTVRAPWAWRPNSAAGSRVRRGWPQRGTLRQERSDTQKW